VTEDELVAHCKSKLAGYKVPRSIVFVDAVQRSPVGKADYPWAKQTATEVLG
jgi:acyl-CoA synthetase (AMP-forming)/AMP-acid ligase II